MTLRVQDMLNGVDLERTRVREIEPERGDRAIRVFISYSHRDDTYREELETHLKLLQRQGEIAIWSDRKIVPGEKWGEKIDDNLEAADVILLMVSADFVASDYCYDIELKRALERDALKEARAIPVILRDCDWSSAPFAKLQALPKGAKPVKLWSDRDTAWRDVARGIRRVADQLRKQRAR